MLGSATKILPLATLTLLFANASTPAQDLTSSLAAGTLVQDAVDQRSGDSSLVWCLRRALIKSSANPPCHPERQTVMAMCILHSQRQRG